MSSILDLFLFILENLCLIASTNPSRLNKFFSCSVTEISRKYPFEFSFVMSRKQSPLAQVFAESDTRVKQNLQK